jgi:elongation factor G
MSDIGTKANASGREPGGESPGISPVTSPAANPVTGARCAVIVGPYQSGKTALFEALLGATGLGATGAASRKGNGKDRNTTGALASEAREQGSDTELSIGWGHFLGEDWSFIDTPGGIEFQLEARHACMIADLAIVVAEPEAGKALSAGPILRFLDVHDIPHVILVNKVDALGERVRDILEALRSVSARPLALRQIPIREGEEVTGYVDLVSERAYRYRAGETSDPITMPDTVTEREAEARAELLEALADFDDALLEQLVEEQTPERERIYGDLTATLTDDLLVPVLLGSGEADHGIQRLLKLIRHEGPTHARTMARRGLDRPGDDGLAPGAGGPVMAQVFKTQHAAHVGKLSHVRVWRGTIKDGQMLNGVKVSGLSRVLGDKLEKRSQAGPGEVVALGRMEPVLTGDILTPEANMPEANMPAANMPEAGMLKPDLGWPEPIQPVYAAALRVGDRGDEVKLSGALAKLVEEDPSLLVHHDADMGEMVLWGQGEGHLRAVLAKLTGRFKLSVTAERPAVAYRETIRKPVERHARHKKQSGGHGQFGDVTIRVEPRPRGSGFAFEQKVVGGAVPKQYIPAVEQGCRDATKQGPLGFPVIDVGVTLLDGQSHAVDSSDMAFKLAGRQAMAEALEAASPVLLEPIHEVVVSTPTDTTSRMHGILSGRRGRILGFDTKDGWPGWDTVTAYLPEAEMGDLILDLRAQSRGLAFFEWRLDHLTELTGRLADQITGRTGDPATKEKAVN